MRAVFGLIVLIGSLIMVGLHTTCTNSGQASLEATSPAYNDPSIVSRLNYDTNSYQNDSINEIRITIDPNRITELVSDLPGSGRKYKDARMQYRGKEFAIKIRLRGDNAYHWWFHKKSYKIKIPKSENVTVLGHNVLQLTNPKSNSMMSEWIGNTIAKGMGLVTVDEQYFKVFINEEYHGLYLSLEPLDKKFLQYNKLPHGDIYRGENIGSDATVNTPHNIFLVDTLWVHKLSRKKAGQTSRKNLSDLLHAIQTVNTKHQEFDKLEALVDLDYFVKFVAYISLIQTLHFDFFHNLVYYHNPETNKFIQIPWDNAAYQMLREYNNLDLATNDLFLALYRSPEFCFRKNELVWLYLNKGNFVREVEAIAKVKKASLHKAIYADRYKGGAGTYNGLPHRFLRSNEEYERLFEEDFIELIRQVHQFESLEADVRVEFVQVRDQLLVSVDGWSSVEFHGLIGCEDPAIADINNNGSIDLEDAEYSGALYSGREQAQVAALHFERTPLLTPAPIYYSFIIQSACEISGLELTNLSTGEKVIAKKVIQFSNVQSKFSIHPWKIGTTQSE